MSRAEALQGLTGLRTALAASLVIALAETLRVDGPLLTVLPSLSRSALLLGVVVGATVVTSLYAAKKLRLVDTLELESADSPAGTSTRLAWMIALALTSIAAFIGLRGVQARFGSPVTHALAIALALPPLALTTAVLARRLRTPLSRSLESKSNPRLLLTVGTFVLLASWMGSLAGLSQGLLATLDLSLPIALGVLGSAALWSQLTPAKPGRVKVERALAGLCACLAVGGFVLEPDDEARDALQRSGLTRVVPSSSSGSNTGSPSCWPEQAVQLPSSKVDPESPDIILLTIDALRWDHTDLARPDAGLTPALARAAQRGVVFERAYTAATATGQSFRVIFTGLLPGIVSAPPATPWGLSLARGQVTLASLLEAAGYQTSAILPLPKVFPEARGGLQGFTRVEALPPALQASPDAGSSSHAASYVVDRIIGQLAGPAQEGPRFVWAHLLEAHSPYFDDPYAPEDAQDPNARYQAAIRYLDRELARLLEHFARPGRAERTIIVITADHGEARGEHGFSDDHGNSLYEEEVHVPLLVWAPGAKPGRVEQLVSLADLLPTLSDLSLGSRPRGPADVASRPSFAATPS